MIRELILGYFFLKTKRLINRTELWGPEEIENLQRKLLSRILYCSIKKVPFYKKNFCGLSKDVGDDPFEVLKLFPIIDKADVKKNLKSFLRKGDVRALKATTGGSTGQPLVFYLDRFATRQREKAFMFDQWGRVGYKFGDPIFNLRGRTPKNNHFIEHDRFFNISYASSFNINADFIDKYIDGMNKVSPAFLLGYPSTIYQLAQLYESSRKKLNFRFKAVLCASEKLYGFQRKKIESAFNCRAYSWYGHSEYLALGGECEYSTKYHFYPQYGYTELLPANLKTEDGREIYEIVATGFNNYVMPLIRYRTGDYAVLSKEQKCSCGRNYLLIDEIIGREQEFIVDKDEFLISTTSLIFGQHFEAFEGIDGIHINQNRPGEIEIIITKNERYLDSMLIKMKDKINSLVKDRLRINFSFSERINQSEIGKAKLVNQELDIKKYLN